MSFLALMVFASVGFATGMKPVDDVESALDLQGSVEIDGVTFSFSGPGNWVSEIEPELDNAVVYKVIPPDTQGITSRMTAEITGPAYIEYQAIQINSSTYHGGLFVDGIEVQRRYPESRWSQNAYQIPEGPHTVEFVFDDNNYSVAGLSPVTYGDIKIVFGYDIRVNHSGGYLSVQPNKPSYQAGDAVSLSVVPIEGNRFVEWSGSVSSNVPAIEWVVDGHVNLEARFEVIDLGFGSNLRISEGVSVYWQRDAVREAEKALIAEPGPGVLTYSIEIDVEYPGRITWDRVDLTVNFATSDDQIFYVDGDRWTNFSRHFRRNEPKHSFFEDLNTGGHTLMWESNNAFTRATSGFRMALENLRYIPNVEGASSFENWALEARLDPEANGAPMDDPNEDGVLNVFHYVVGSDPLSPFRTGRFQRIAIKEIEAEHRLTLTLPTRSGISFSSDANGQQVAMVEGMEILIQATDNFLDFEAGEVEILQPALSEGLPILSSEYEYSTFIAKEPITSERSAYMRIRTRDDS